MRLIALLPVALLSIATIAQATDVQAVLAPLRNQIEASDYRATGQIVRVDANGHRITDSVSVKGLWFAGGLHVLADITPSKSVAAKAQQDERMRILLEVRPDGRDSIRIFRPHKPLPAALPFDKWDEGVLGGEFSYEDLLDSQYFWQGQAILKSAAFGGRQCDVLKSTSGPSDHTHYSDVQTWLDRSIHYPVYAEKVMKQGGIVKEFTYYGLRQSSGVWSASQIEAKIRGRAGSAFLIVKRGSARAHLNLNEFQPEKISHFEDRP